MSDNVFYITVISIIATTLALLIGCVLFDSLSKADKANAAAAAYRADVLRCHQINQHRQALEVTQLCKGSQ